MTTKKPLNNDNVPAYKAHQLEHLNILLVFQSGVLISPLICLNGSEQLFHQEFWAEHRPCFRISRRLARVQFGPLPDW